MKTLLLFAVVLLGCKAAAAQVVVGIEPLAANEIRSWVATLASDYAGSYHFGFSECESTFNLHTSKGIATATKQSTDMATMRQITKVFTHVRIAGNKFYSDQANGEFVTFAVVEGSARGLKILRPWSCSVPKGKAEIGARL